MDSKQIDTAMRNRTQVVYDGKRYVRILEYVMWYDNQGRRQLSAVLLEGNCTIKVPADKVEEYKE